MLFALYNGYIYKGYIVLSICALPASLSLLYAHLARLNPNYHTLAHDYYVFFTGHVITLVLLSCDGREGGVSSNNLLSVSPPFSNIHWIVLVNFITDPVKSHVKCLWMFLLDLSVGYTCCSRTVYLNMCGCLWPLHLLQFWPTWVFFLAVQKCFPKFFLCCKYHNILHDFA